MKRLLVTISYSFSIRYIYRSGLLHQLKTFCEPVVVITWNEKDLVSELRSEGFEVYIIPESTRDSLYADVRKKIDIWFRHFALKSPSTKIQQDYLDQFLPARKKLLRKLREIYNLLKLHIPGHTKKLFEKEKLLLRTHTNYNELSAIVDSLNVDAVFTVTPFHRQEDVLLHVCKGKGLQMLTAILSFDNLTKRGWIPVEYDAYLLWNKLNEQQLFRIYPNTKKKKVHITGSVQFDFYFDEKNILAKNEWREMVGMPLFENRKIILYSGGPLSLFPQEPVYLKDIDEAITKGEIKNKPIILFRCHPIDKIERWKNFYHYRNVVFDSSWTGEENLNYANITDDDIRKLCSTLAYTDVHINLCSTMVVDGSAFNKPQIGPAYITNDKKGSKLLKQMYYQEHFAPIVNIGGLVLAESSEQMVLLINNALNHEGNYSKTSTAVLKEVITYYDGKNALRVADSIKQYLCHQKEVEKAYN